MKKYLLISSVAFCLFTCNSEKKSFDRIYFVSYNRPLKGLPDNFSGQPPIFISKFVEIGSDGIVINSNRSSSDDSSINFYRSQLPEKFLEPLNNIGTKYDHDESFLDLNSNGTFDSYYYRALLIETKKKNVLIEFLDNHSIPDELKPIVFNFWEPAQEKHSTEMTSSQFYSFQMKLDEILLKRSKLLPPPIKTIIKFLPPKVDSVKK